MKKDQLSRLEFCLLICSLWILPSSLSAATSEGGFSGFGPQGVFYRFHNEGEEESTYFWGRKLDLIDTATGRLLHKNLEPLGVSTDRRKVAYRPQESRFENAKGIVVFDVVDKLETIVFPEIPSYQIFRVKFSENGKGIVGHRGNGDEFYVSLVKNNASPHTIDAPLNDKPPMLFDESGSRLLVCVFVDPDARTIGGKNYRKVEWRVIDIQSGDIVSRLKVNLIGHDGEETQSIVASRNLDRVILSEWTESEIGEHNISRCVLSWDTRNETSTQIFKDDPLNPWIINRDAMPELKIVEAAGREFLFWSGNRHDFEDGGFPHAQNDGHLRFGNSRV